MGPCSCTSCASCKGNCGSCGCAQCGKVGDSSSRLNGLINPPPNLPLQPALVNFCP
ncbi:MAG: hypothetical protein Q9194_002462 [Teloschistes cf. exilis]